MGLAFNIGTIFIITVCASMAMADDLKVKSEKIADQSYYRQSLIKLLYDKDIDYRTHFGCESILLETKNDKDAIDAACIIKNRVLFISTGMGPKKRLSSADVCLSEQSVSLIETLKGLSYVSKAPGNGSTLYHMGFTDGWIRKFQNVFVTMSRGGESLSCWSLLRR